MKKKSRKKKQKTILEKIRDIFFEYEIVGPLTHMNQSDIKIIEMLEKNNKKNKKALKEVSDEKIQALLEEQKIEEEKYQQEEKEYFKTKNKLLNKMHIYFIMGIIISFSISFFKLVDTGIDFSSPQRVRGYIYIIYAFCCQMTFLLTMYQLYNAFKFNEIIDINEVKDVIKDIYIKILFIVPLTIISMIMKVEYCALVSVVVIIIPIIILNKLLFTILTKKQEKELDMKGLV